MESESESESESGSGNKQFAFGESKRGSNFLSFFSCSFWEKVGQIIGWRPSFGVGSHPSGKSCMRHCQWWKWEGDLTSRTGNGNQQNSHALWRTKPLGRTSKTKPPCQFLYEFPTTRSSSNVMYVMYNTVKPWKPCVTSHDVY